MTIALNAFRASGLRTAQRFGQQQRNASTFWNEKFFWQHANIGPFFLGVFFFFPGVLPAARGLENNSLCLLPFGG